MSVLDEAKRVAAQFEYTDADVRKGVAEFIKQMNQGLGTSPSTLSQIPTYVTSVPDGTEKGLYLAMDLGGTNLRICSIDLYGDQTFNLTQSKVGISKDLMEASTATELFAFLAEQIELFLGQHHVYLFESKDRQRKTTSTPESYREEDYFRLGFTCSFPVHQTGINKGTLIRWTKGFNISDAIGKDVCHLLQTEIDRLRLPVRVAALVNDAVGTLMARSYTSPGKTGTLLGAIFGTGTNGAYVEKLSKITKPVEGLCDNTTGELVVSTEWGSFDNDLKVIPNTIYDQILDRQSINPRIQMFEKRISGMFLGELLRIVLLEMLKSPTTPLFLGDKASSKDFRSPTAIAERSALHKEWAVDSSILSIAEADISIGLRHLRQALKKSLGVSASVEDAEAVKTISHAIGRRAARLAGVAFSAIILQTGSLNRSSPTTPHSSAELKSTAAITQDIKALNLNVATTAALNKVADAAGIPLSGDGVVDIGVDGSLYEFYPGFEDLIRETLRAVEGIGASGEKRVRIGIAEDGSAVGAALVALGAAGREVPGRDSETRRDC